MRGELYREGRGGLAGLSILEDDHHHIISYVALPLQLCVQ
jgi:hypothetical protein